MQKRFVTAALSFGISFVFWSFTIATGYIPGPAIEDARREGIFMYMVLSATITFTSATLLHGMELEGMIGDVNG